MVDWPFLPPDQQPVLQAVLRLAQTCEYEVNHTLQVTYLAVRLFDDLQPLHNLGQVERSWLIFAAILHDIGWIEGWKEHHKVTLRIILTTPMLQFSNKERLIIGSIARYHRKSLPSIKHDHFAALLTEEREKVKILAGMLRLADALDHSHQQRLREIRCKTGAKKISICCTVNQDAAEEKEAVQEKSDLLERSLKRTILFEGLV
ncbi:MAG: HD domain-containing protein [Saprospiraceae bacterium]|nr:HD domain-containing protein [Saprospiraceae bacterium]